MSHHSPTDDRRRFVLAWTAAGMILAASAMRLLPHPPNATPILAVALFAGGTFASRRAALLVPLGAMMLSDLGLASLGRGGFHALLPVVYAAIAACTVVGFPLRNRSSLAWTAGAAVVASVLFYLVTNFAVWGLGTSYPMTAPGLGACYLAGLPFFRNTLASTVGYSVALFALHGAIGSMVTRTAHGR